MTKCTLSNTGGDSRPLRLPPERAINITVLRMSGTGQRQPINERAKLLLFLNEKGHYLLNLKIELFVCISASYITRSRDPFHSTTTFLLYVRLNELIVVSLMFLL